MYGYPVYENRLARVGRIAKAAANWRRHGVLSSTRRQRWATRSPLNGSTIVTTTARSGSTSSACAKERFSTSRLPSAANGFESSRPDGRSAMSKTDTSKRILAEEGAPHLRRCGR